MSKPSDGRIPELDAIRAFAVLAVLLYHGGFTTGVRTLDVPFKLGWTAVDLFFLLSGYLITSIILAHQVDRHFLYAFYARRALRIWPIYYLAIGVLALLSISRLMPDSWPPLTGRLLAHYLTFTQAVPSYWGDNSAYYHPVGHFWSLAVEEQFYLVWPFLLALTGKRGVVPLAVGFILLAHGYRLVGEPSSRHLLLVRCDGLAFGAILAVITAREGFARSRRIHAAVFATIALGSVVALGVCVAKVSRDYLWTNSLLLFATPFFLGVVGWVVSSSGSRWLAPLRSRWLGYVGRISYGLYLYHFIFYVLIDDLSGHREGTQSLLAPKLVITFLVAVVSWEYLEKPILAWKDRFPYDRAPRQAGRPTRSAAPENVPTPPGCG